MKRPKGIIINLPERQARLLLALVDNKLEQAEYYANLKSLTASGKKRMDGTAKELRLIKEYIQLSLE